jgi:hypothetical protein
VAAVNSLIKIVQRPDVAKTMRDDKLIFSGFKITLDFSTVSDAKRAALDICMAADSATHRIHT